MKGFKQSLLISLWFIFLTFPIMVIKVNTTENLVEWRWERILYVGAGSFLLSYIWRFMLEKKETGRKPDARGEPPDLPLARYWPADRRFFLPLFSLAAVFTLIFPLLFSSYQTNIMTNALMFIVLGLGLNIVVGLAGLLDLGYVAFYAVGAYTYALLNHHFGLGFWLVLPISAAMAAMFGLLLGFPVLGLRGDYLAIVTLGFGEITRLVLENWNEFSFGPSGIANIPKPALFGHQFSLNNSFVFVYYVMLGLTVFTIFVVNRLQNSRIGRAWIAMREDETACQAMGIDIRKTKLTAFALGATWAGMVGAIFAAKTTFVNPASFTFLESAIILSLIVLGGMGSIIGVIVGALILILLPEYLRAVQEYRMLIFGAILIIMMVFRPQGLISKVRRRYEFHESDRTE